MTVVLCDGRNWGGTDKHSAVAGMDSRTMIESRAEAMERSSTDLTER